MVPVDSPDMASSEPGLGSSQEQLEMGLEAVAAMVSAGTGPMGRGWVGVPGKAEPGWKSLFLPSGTQRPYVLICSSTQFLWVLDSCHGVSLFLLSPLDLICSPHTSFSICAGRYCPSGIPVSHWKTSVTQF